MPRTQDNIVRVSVEFEDQERRDFRVACMKHGLDMSAVIRKFAEHFTAEPEKTIKFIKMQ